MRRRRDAWGVTPAVAGVRVARAATEQVARKSIETTCVRSGPRHSTALRAVTPAGAASSPFRLRSLRFSVCELRYLRNLLLASAPVSRQSI